MTTTLPNFVTALGSKMTSFKKISALLVLLLISSLSFGQNAIVGTGFSTGWGGGSCPTGNSNFKYLSLITGANGTGTYGVTTAANGTGNQYMRFGIDWSTTNGQYAINPGTDTAILPNTSYNLNIGCTVSGSQFINVGSTSYNYVFKTFNAGTNPTGTFAFFEVQGAVQSVSSVSQSPVAASVVPSSNVTVTANLSGSLSTGQAVYLRYTNNAFANSTVVQMTGSGSTYTAQIPSSMNGQNKTVAYYVFTSGNSLNSANSGATGVYANGNNADLFTINLNNNVGSNYSYTVANSPVIVNATTGTVGPTGYATFAAAVTAINAGTHTGVVTVSIVGATTEGTANIPINASGSGSASYTSITVKPAGGAQTLTAATVAGSAFITLNGADNVTFDGLNTNGNSLKISNTTSSTTAGTSTIRFLGDATSNTIQNCTITGSTTAAAGGLTGVINFSTGTTTGNTGNTITGNTISAEGANLPLFLIYSLGTSAVPNTVTVSNNNFADWAITSASDNGAVWLAATGNTAWSITGNKMYQTASRVGGASLSYGINVLTGNGYTINNNTIGFANSAGTGTLTVTSGGASRIIGIKLDVLTTTATEVQGNTIAGISLATTSGATTAPGIFSGIYVPGGKVNIGQTTANTIGATTGTGSIVVTSSTSGGVTNAISATSTSTVQITGNTIGAISALGTSAAVGSVLNGIATSGTAGNYTITSNTIGNATANSIQVGVSGTTTAIGTFVGITNAATGATSITGNTIQNVTAYGTGNNVMKGIENTGSASTLTVSSNNLLGFSMPASTTGTVTGIVNSGSVTTSITINTNALGNATAGYVTYGAANSGALTGISNTGGGTSCALSIQTNDFRGITHSVAGSSAHTYIINTAATASQNISSNTFTNLNVNTTGSVTFISNDVALSATGTCTVNTNSIVTAFNKAGAGGTVSCYLTTTGPSSVIGAIKNEQNNNFSNVTLTGATTVNVWSDLEGASTPGPTKTISGNTFSNWTCGSGAFVGIQTNFSGNNTSIATNTISNVTGSGAMTGISVGSSSGGATETVSGNTISSLVSTEGLVNGITGSFSGITTTNINGNTITGLSSTLTGNTNAIAVTTGATVNIFKNKIYNISASNAGSIVSGVLVSSVTTSNVYNNIIGDLRSTAGTQAAPTESVIGLNFANTTGTTVNALFNTVYLNASSTGTNFSTSALFTNTGNTTVLRNNILVNASTAAGTGKTVAYRRSSNTLTSYSTTSNNNDLFATNLYFDGTTPQTTLTGYKTAMLTRDQAAVSENPTFVSTTGSASTYLHINTSTATQLESGGVTVSGVTDDFDGDTRTSTPDIGADEFTGTPILPTITLSSNTIAAGNITANTTNNVLYSFAIGVTGSNANLTGLTATTTGTYVSADITNLKAWYQTSATFNSGTATLLSTLTTPGVAGSKNFPSFVAQTISAGATGYIFITADLPCLATGANTIAINSITASNTTFVSGTPTGSPSAGNTQTIVAATVNNVTSPAASILNASSSVSWVNPTGCFDEILIVARAGSANDGIPTGNGTAYTGNLAFGSGTALGSGFVVYKGSTSPQTITGLSNGTAYYYEIFTRNGSIWSSGIEVNATPNTTYCSPSMTSASASGDYIGNVTFAGINNTTGDTATDYTYYNALTASVNAGQGYPISLLAGGISTTYAQQFGVWIDYNQNGFFTDNGEFVFATTTANYSPTASTGTITIPAISASVFSGTTRMRIGSRYSTAVASTNSCLGGSTFGEYEDYNITITAPCTQPTTQATIGSYTANTTGTSLTVNWTRGNGTGGVIVVARATTTSNVLPTGGTTYTPSVVGAFGGSTTTGTGNIVVYNGTGTTVDVTGLTAGTSYTFSVYEFNSTSNCYNTSASSSAVTTCTSGTPSVAITVTTGANPTCTGSSVTFTATPTNGGTPTYQWKLNGTNVGTSSTTYTNAALANGDLVSCVMTNSAACTTTATSNTITMSVTAAPTTSNAGTAQSSCGGTTPVTLAANTPSVGTGAWTVTSGPSTLVSQFSSTTNPTAVFTPAGGTGAYVLTWTITSGGCSSASTVTITVNAAAPTTTGALICQGSTGNLTSTFTGLSVNNNFSMSNVISGGSTYTRSTGGTTYTASSLVTYSTIRIRPTTTGSYVLNGCASGDTHMQLYATTFTPASPSVNFIAADDDGNTATCTSDPRLTVTLTANQDYILVYTPFSGTGAVTGITITVTPPSGGNMQVVSSATLDWYTVSTGGTKIGSGTTFNPVGVANSGLADTNTAGTTTYYAATSDNTTCRTATTFVINPLPQGSLSANGPFCASGAGQLTWTATAGTGPFTVVYNDGVANRTETGVVSGTPFNIFTTPVTASTTYTLVSVTDSSTTTCARTFGFTGATATITVNPTPTTANAGPDQSVCSANTITLAANTATSGTGAWSIVSGSGGTVTTTSSPTSTFTGTAGATYTLRWTISSGVCTASTDDVVITIFSPLDFVNLQFPESATICQGSSLTAYGQVYEADVTPGGGQGANIIVEFGYNGTNTNPSTWSNWFTASYNSTVTNNNDEYQYNFTPPTNGTFYYTFRYKQGTCDTWQYGGFSGTGGGTWGGANVSGVLTVNSNAAHTISLSSGSATPALCQNTLLGNTIVYAIGGGATSAGVTGLPSGMSGSFNSGNFTINGTPTASGIFNFTVTTTGNSCASAVTASGTITVSSDLDFVNLQWPPSGSICSTGTYTVYGQVYESGVTNSAGQGSGITVEFGYNGTNSNPSTWTNWSTASYSIDSGNNDEYLYTFTPPSSGTFYYTFRYRQGSCNWIYGGYSAGGGGAWSGSNVSGILTVTASPSAGTLGGSQAVCISDSTTFTSTSSDGSWSSSDTGVASIDATTGVVTPVAAGTATMTYTVTGTGGCSNATNTRTVTVNQVTNGGTASSNQIICSGETPSAITLASSVGSVVKWQSSSDAAFTSPTDITNTSTTLTLGSLSATTYYRAVVQSGACSSANSNVVTITVNSLPTVSIASNNSPVCSGAASFSLTGTTDAVVTYNINGGTNATTTLTGGAATISVPNPFASQVLTLVSVANNGCTSSLSDTSTVSVIATTYDGTSWSNGNPDSSKLAIFTGNYTIAADLTACSLRVTNNAVVTVNSNYNVYLNGAITVDSGSSFTMNNNTNLLQSDASAVNTGNIIVKRNTSTIVRLDHTLWSSPVTGQNLFSFSPNTLVNRFYVYNTATNSYVTTGLSNTSLFTPAKGFAVRAPNNQSATTPAVWTGTFTGVPNNGTKTFTLATNAANGYNYNLVGNPYPSAISASNFYAANASKIGGTLYFYAHTLTMNASGIFPTGTNYATWTGLGGAAATAGDGHTPAVAPNGIIQVGQGFIVRATASGDVTFTNAMRVANQQNQFMKAATASAETHRMWLNLKTDTGVDVNQILVGYMDGATQGVDAGLDGLSFGNTGSYLYSKIENDNFVIQARSLPFDVTDEVPLGFNCATAGSYSISLTNTDGLFAADQDILVRDNLTGTDTSIKTVPYTFNSETGVFDTRFRLVYTQALGVPSTNFTENSVIVYKNTDWFHVNTKGIEMKDIMVYDISGRLIYSKKEINATTAVLNGLTTTNQVLILKINSIEDKTVTIKVIN